jgi:hypothetical protein
MIKYLTLILSVILVSCDKQIPYDDVNFKPKLVLNAFNNSDSLLKLKLDESFKLLGSPSTQKLSMPIDIQLFKDSIRIIDDVFWVDKGQVFLPHTVEEGSFYHLKADVSDYPSIQSSDRVPLDNVNLNIDSISAGSIFHQLDLTIKDPITDNFYILDLSIVGKQLILTDSVIKQYPVIFSSKDKIFSSTIQTISEGSKRVLFDDVLFNGLDRKIGLRIQKDSLIHLGFRPQSIHVRLKSVSESMYNYYLMLIQNNHVFGGPLYFEGQIEGNVNGGLGGFYFYNQYIDSIPFKL